MEGGGEEVTSDVYRKPVFSLVVIMSTINLTRRGRMENEENHVSSDGRPAVVGNG